MLRGVNKTKRGSKREVEFVREKNNRGAHASPFPQDYFHARNLLQYYMKVIKLLHVNWVLFKIWLSVDMRGCFVRYTF